MKDRIIEKKVLPKYFRGLSCRAKTFEIRKDEDDVEVGDILLLREWDGEAYTGRRLKRVVTYVLRNCPEYGLKEGYAIYGLHQIGWDATFTQNGNNNVQIGYVKEMRL